MSKDSEKRRIRRAAETLSRYDQTEEVRADDCQHVSPTTEGEEIEQMLDLQEAWEAVFDQIGW